MRVHVFIPCVPLLALLLEDLDHLPRSWSVCLGLLLEDLDALSRCICSGLLGLQLPP